MKDIYINMHLFLLKPNKFCYLILLTSHIFVVISRKSLCPILLLFGSHFKSGINDASCDPWVAPLVRDTIDAMM